MATGKKTDICVAESIIAINQHAKIVLCF
jgi:hypothetical protein